MIKDFHLHTKFFTEQVFNNSENIKLILYFCIVLATTSLIYGSVQGNFTNLISLLMMFVIAIFIYLFFQKKYNKNMKKAGRKFRKFAKSHLLQKLCKSKFRKKNICQKYDHATENYNKINDMLLKQYQ